MSDLRELKREVSIIDYANHLGFTITKVGTYYSLKEHDSIRIDPRKNLFYQNSTGKGGSVLDFATTFLNCSIHEAIEQVSAFYEKRGPGEKGFLKENPTSRESLNQGKKRLVLPEKDDTMKHVFAYLIKTRKIHADIVTELAHKKQLYQDQNNNCVFVNYHDEKPVFAFRRGTNTKKKYVNDVPGSDYQYSFFVNHQADQLMITESVIDGLSKMTLLKLEGKEREYDYLCLTGVSKYKKAVLHYCKLKPYSSIVISLDNDLAGEYCSKAIKQLLEEIQFPGEITICPPKRKDINEDLIELEKGKSHDSICRK